MTRTGRILLALAASTCLTGLAWAQTADAPSTAAKSPVAFAADAVSYDKTGDIVTITGHVHAVQNGQVLNADSVTINRRTNVAVASGHVVLTQPDGTSVFANHAVLTQGMGDAVLQGVAARLADNGRMIANGAQRYSGKVDVLTHVVYSACNLCATDPRRPPTWTIRARTATRDLQHHMIEYRDAMMEIHGIPVFYTPYLTMPDPSVRRKSGFLIPNFGSSSRLGFFFTVPYYLVLGNSADLTLTPIIAAKEGPALRGTYREAFNDGTLNVNLSGGEVHNTGQSELGDSIFANGQFDLNQDWRAGFEYDHASNPTYLDDFSILPLVPYLTSQAYLEGFSSGSYARVDVESFQGMVASVTQSKLPIVLPHAQYHYLADQDGWGGQVSLDADAFDVLRHVGTNSHRVAFEPGYQLPVVLPFGIMGEARVKLVTAGYGASHLGQQPNYSLGTGSPSTGRAEPYGAVLLRWPFVRQGWGTQLIEPEAQLVAAPEVGIAQNATIPNEDSLDLEYSDANLFDLNRYPGIDRLEGGARADYALHGAWYLPSGATVDGLIGQSYRLHKDNVYLLDSGLTDNVSDIVARATLTPTPWLNFSYRTRLNHTDFNARMIDATASVGGPKLMLSGGYFYSNTNPYVLYDSASPTGQITLTPPTGYFTPRKDVTGALSTALGAWSVGASVQRDLANGKFDSAGLTLGWQNDCMGVNLDYTQRFVSYNLDKGNALVLIQLTFKTLGNVGINAQ